jgi:hypothetical protein
MAFRVEPDNMPTRRVWALEGRRTSWEELPHVGAACRCDVYGRAPEGVSVEGRSL